MEETKCEKRALTSMPTSLQVAKRQLTINESLRGKVMWDVCNPRSKEIDKLIGEMVALQDLPFNFVEGIGFRRLMESVLPRYVLRGRQYFTEYVCETMYAEIKNQIVQLLKTFNKLSFTTDIWSEPSAGVSLLSLTAHGISLEFKRVNIVLRCESIEGSHTGDVIKSTILSMINEWQISDKVHCVVHDKGSNMIRAMNLTNFLHINCSVHQLQLCIKNALNLKEIQGLIATNRKLVSHFNHSLLAKEKLSNIQKNKLNQKPLGVIQDCPTRWNSTYYMMERLLKIKDSIILYLNNYEQLSITLDDWKIMEKCVNILKPFEEVTRELSSSTISISSVIPLIHILTSKLNKEKSLESGPPYVAKIIETLMYELNFRFSDLRQTPIFSISSYLDPRYKLKFFGEDDKNKIRSELVKLIHQNYSDVEVCNSSTKITEKTTLIANDNDAGPHNASSQIQADIEMFLNEDSSDIEYEVDEILTVSEINEILKEYDKERKVHISQDPLLWWKKKLLKYKILVPVVRQFLSTPPGSVPSEQLFSGAGLIYDTRRFNLKSDKAAKLLFIKYNLAQLNFEY
ncbi:LOW QUALITY PROTEIN: zinc finger BED domain-containing protein 4-like [Lucilia cuprina]|uniref:LOW QUALITY PROTEIN: zinc finger BED domain-containing protein 4-like n=1 Tax=Lucilia cuprina TaxID=7375 RepID=UPI001F057F9B|nr:LOW QUALITY PROTEIN: zinc finger BED domain-containing protein 4-like [Lucilia cuprina]